MGVKGFFRTLVLGAGAMYFLDPDLGGQRRTLVRDRLMSLQQEAQDLWDSGTRDLQNRVQGVQARMQSNGELPSDAVRAVSQVSIEQELAPGLRLLSLAGGGLLALYGKLRGGISGKIITLAGMNFVTRGLTNRGLASMLQPARAGVISIRRDLHIEAPLEEVYSFWRQYDNLPRFMSHLEEVRDLGEERSHWVAKGSRGETVEWDARITQMEPNRVLAWESLPGSQVYSSGRVRFTPAGAGTHLSIHMAYSPPGGATSRPVPSFFQGDPTAALDRDFVRLQALFERGQADTAAKRSKSSSASQTTEQPVKASTSETASKSRNSQDVRAAAGQPANGKIGSETDNESSGGRKSAKQG